MRGLIPGVSIVLIGHGIALLYYYNLIKPMSSTVEKAMETPYDFIVVGAGSAGSVVASRLSEDTDVRVLLLEAGGGPTFLSTIPFGPHMMQLTKVDWQYKTESQQHSCLSMVKNQSFWARGKLLGGTSSINYMIYTRGNRRDYDLWHSLGNEGWSYKDVLPFFRKSEDNHVPLAKNDDVYHSAGGYLTITNPNYLTPMLDSFIAAANDLGIPTRDVNGEHEFGVMPLPVTIRNGRRCSTARAFLKPAIERPNLHILMNSHVVKVLFDSNKRAVGVEFERKGKKYTARASKEVILSTGTIATPQLLMLSGIGPRAHLEEFNIPVVADRPGVGENLQDHISAGGLVWTVDQPIALVMKRVLRPLNILNWLAFGKGPLSSAGGAESVAFVNTPNNTDKEWPDIEIHFAGGSPTTDRGAYIWPGKGGNRVTWEKYYVPIVDKDTYYILPSVMRPKSKGFIRLRTKNPYDHPIIEPRYYEDNEDMKLTLDGIKLALALGNSKHFKKFGSKFIPTVLPGCEHVKLYSDAYWECVARHETITMDHLVGTAKMGPKSDPMAVVDHQLRVHGIKNLRVMDASIMPTVPTSNTNAPTIMIGEKGSDYIIKQYKLKSV